MSAGLSLPSPCLVVLAGPGASGKSTWAAEHFPPDQVVSSDRLRAVVGSGEDDVSASTDAFELLEEIVRLRVGRGLTTVVDTLGLDASRRAVCGVGLAWFGAEHEAYGWDFPATGDRYALLEDALRLLPMLWGPGSPAFHGDVLDVPEAFCYPRPLQGHVPLLVGGGGERCTLRLAARYADAANVFGDASTVRHKAEVLREHCRDADRDPSEVAMTHLSPRWSVPTTGTSRSWSTPGVRVAAAPRRTPPRSTRARSRTTSGGSASSPRPARPR